MSFWVLEAELCRVKFPYEAVQDERGPRKNKGIKPVHSNRSTSSSNSSRPLFPVRTTLTIPSLQGKIFQHSLPAPMTAPQTAGCPLVPNFSTSVAFHNHAKLDSPNSATGVLRSSNRSAFRRVVPKDHAKISSRQPSGESAKLSFRQLHLHSMCFYLWLFFLLPLRSHGT